MSAGRRRGDGRVSLHSPERSQGALHPVASQTSAHLPNCLAFTAETRDIKAKLNTLRLPTGFSLFGSVNRHAKCKTETAIHNDKVMDLERLPELLLKFDHLVNFNATAISDK